MSFIHLHNHSEFSPLDGMSQINQMVKAAKSLGMPGMAISDHGNMAGALDFFYACQKENIKPIIGMEGYITPFGIPHTDRKDKTNSHILLLAMNRQGYQNLMKLTTISYKRGVYYKPRIDWALLEEFNEGIITTTGCLGAELHNEYIRDGNVEGAEKAFQRFLSLFGNRFYAELQDHGAPEFKEYNDWLAGVANRYGVPMIATNDSHYISKDDVIPHDLMLCIGTGSKYTDEERFRMHGDSYYIKSESEMQKLFSEYKGAISNTLELASRCELDLTDKKFHLPHFEIPDNQTDNEYLGKITKAGFVARYGEREDKLNISSVLVSDKQKAHPDLTFKKLNERLNYELGIIAKMKFSTYFLIVNDIIQFCRDNNIWYNIRGSAAGSLVAHCLGVTDVEPISNDLFFERFLNPDRVSMPDIDMDFEHSRRQEVIEYTINKYGADKVSQIATFGTMQTRNAIRDCFRVMRIPLNETNRLLGFLPTNPNQALDLSGALEKIPEIKAAYNSNSDIKKAFDAAIRLEGTVRNVGTHAAGIVIADKPLVEYVPLMNVKGGGSMMTQFEMGKLESIGLLKMDYLGLKTLTLMHKVCDRINKEYGLDFNLENIPIHDDSIYKLLKTGRTLGVFQLESQGMTQVITQMKPTAYDNIVAAVALFRPGPLEYIPTYIKRFHGEAEVEYRHPDLEKSLGSTMGIMIYQEQVLSIASDIAGYSKAEADMIRKAVGKKDIPGLLKHKEKFISGAISKGYSKELGEGIWIDIEYFSRYGFCKSHAADYAKLTCQTAYLKAKYPVEFMTEYLNVEYADGEKVEQIFKECRAIGIKVLAPDVSVSSTEFDVIYPSSISFGLKAVKGVGEDVIKKMVDARSGLFSNFEGFVYGSNLPTRTLEPLIKAGACDKLGQRSKLLKEVAGLTKATKAKSKAKMVGQDMAVDITSDDLVEPQGALTLTDLEDEKETLGFYFNEHPTYGRITEMNATHNSSSIKELQKGDTINVAGVVKSVREITTKTGKQMAFALIEDATGQIDLTIFPKQWDQYKEILIIGSVLRFSGKYDDIGKNPKMLVDLITDQPNKLVVSTPKSLERLYIFIPNSQRDKEGAIVLIGNMAESFFGNKLLSIVVGQQIIDTEYKVSDDILLETLQLLH